ncbi:MAG: four helix bundle protein [Patescibacteria group bacterium]
MYKEFHELSIWREGYELLMKVYTLTEKFPSEEKYALASQTVRSGNSVIANIAESHGRFSYQDKIRVLYIARGEIMETRSHIAVALGRKYITQEEFLHLNNNYCQLTKDLNAYINSLRKKKQ